mmetsp:Transcript_55986/g.131267  ORF Transcript_55986/g.131267 Transcript_55986/m.131267 type:complete len:87 (+) Transcript_55986:75-335(+)
MCGTSLLLLLEVALPLGDTSRTGTIRRGRSGQRPREKARSFRQHCELQQASVKTELCEQSQDAACKDAQDEAQLHDNTSPMLLGGV